MTQTKADLVREVMGELFALASGQGVAPEDQTWVEQRIETTLASLATRNICYVAGADEIDDAVFNHLADYLAQVCAPKFGRPRDRAAMVLIEEQIRTIERVNQAPKPPLRLDRALRPSRRLPL